MAVKFGIIGLGKIAHRFAGALKMVPGVELAAVASRDMTRSEQFAEQYQAARICAHYEDLYLDPDVDVVYISLVNSQHFEIARQCLEHHKPVLCEKPLVTTRREAENLVNLARANTTFLMEALWTRCMPAFQRAKAWVKADWIGDVKLITANFSFLGDSSPENRLYNPLLQGGSLFDAGIYPIDFATGILDEFPNAVSGLARIASTGVDEAESFSLGFPCGAMASLNSGFTVNARNQAVIYGTRGRIVVEECVGPQWCDCFDENGRLLEHFEELTPDGFVYQIQHCADLIRAGKLESDLIPWADSISSARIFDELRRQWGLLQ